MSDPLVDRAIHKALERSSGPAGGCPDMNRMTAYLERRCDAGERAQFEEHLAECGTCRDVLAFCLEGSQTDPAVTPVRERSGSQAFLRFAVPASALALAAAAFLAVVVIRRSNPGAPVTRVAEVRSSAKMAGSPAIAQPAADAAAGQNSAVKPASRLHVYSGPARAEEPEPDAAAVAKAKEPQEDTKTLELQAPPVPVMQAAEAAKPAPETLPGPARIPPAQDLQMADRRVAQPEPLQAQQSRTSGGEPARTARVAASAVRNYVVAREVQPPEEVIAGFSALAKPGGSDVRKAGEKTFYLRSGYWIDTLCASNPKAPLEQAPRGGKVHEKVTGQFPWLADFGSTPVLLYWNAKIYVVR